MSRIAPILIAFALVAGTHSARADNGATAQALFDDAKELANEGRYDLACPRFQESLKIDNGLGTEFHLADCWQHLGRTATAWSLFRDVETQAHALRQVARERIAHDRALALEPRVPKLVVVPRETVVTVGTKFPVANLNVQILRDGIELTRQEWNVPLPVDPGVHVVTLLAPTKRPWDTRVEVPGPGNDKIVTVYLPSLADVPDAIGPTTAVAATVTETGRVRPAQGVTEPMPPSVGEEPATANRGGAQRAIGWAFVGAGIAGGATGGYFTAQWLEERNPSSAQARNEASTSTILLGSSASALVIGTLLLATAPSSPPASPPAATTNAAHLEVVPVLGVARREVRGSSTPEGGISLRGAW